MTVAKWKILESNYLVDDKWLRLRVDRCELPDGRIIAPFYVYELPDWAIVLALTREQRVVLVRQYRHGRQQIGPELISGIIEKNENPLDAARRELLEETGYAGTQWIDLGTTCANPDSHTNNAHLFLTLDAYPAGAQNLDPLEILDVELISLSEMWRRAQDGRFLQAMHLAAILRAMPHLPKNV
ncbi:MAG: NUDIX hydrolase [Leptospiraceae bacterium]|nr:NUDIX hydrolase [Leptospiraceae bacterium]